MQKYYKSYYLIILCCFIITTSIGQATEINKKEYRLEKVINQNKNVFRFWRGITDSTHNKIIIEKKYKGKNTILFNHFVRDGIYFVEDRNNDGYKDFVITYHYYALVYFFNKKKNQFSKTEEWVELKYGLIDSSKNIFWGYRNSQYAERYDYSLLYDFKRFKHNIYYKIVYKTPDEGEERKYANKIELYKFKDNEVSNPIFVKVIKSRYPAKFNYKKYWAEHYKVLLGYL